MNIDNEIVELSNRLKNETLGICTSDLIRLDVSDRVLIREHLRSSLANIIRIKAIGKAGCSVVIEALEENGSRLDC